MNSSVETSSSPPSDHPDKQLGPISRALNLIKVSRRGLFGRAAIGAAAYATARLGINHAEIDPVLESMNERRLRLKKDSYTPLDPSKIISEEAKHHFLSLLEENTTLSEQRKKAIAVLLPRVARLATLYFYPQTETQTEQDQEFQEYLQVFMELFLQYASLTDIPPEAALMAFQISGANTNSIKAYNLDVVAETARVGTGVATILIGEKAVAELLASTRHISDGVYYSLPRAEGPQSIGIHDIELIEVVKAIAYFRDMNSQGWGTLFKQIHAQAPEFLTTMPDLLVEFYRFNAKSEQIAKDLESTQYQSLLTSLQNPEFLRNFLTDSETRVDGYQFVRTTAYWSHVTEISYQQGASSYSSKRELIEELALQKTIETYNSPEGIKHFVLDQFSNPKFIKLLDQKAKNGDEQAASLLQTAKKFKEQGDELLHITRKTEATVTQLEFSTQFQLRTGMIYARSVYDLGREAIETRTQAQFDQNNPNHLAFASFIGLSKREASPAWELTGHRPLHKSTLTFAPEQQVIDSFFTFLNEVYVPVVGSHPVDDFKTFAKLFMHLLEEPSAVISSGVHRFELENDSQTAKLFKAAENWGFYKKIISYPHCNWMRCLESTIGYGAVAA